MSVAQRILTIGGAEMAAIQDLRARAAAQPLDLAELVKAAETPDGKARFMATLRNLSVRIPDCYSVTYSVEVQPCGLCRHMSVSVGTVPDGLMPHPGAVNILAGAFGFQGGIDSWMLWEEMTADGFRAMNVLQPVAVMEEAVA
ncbi:MAG TPA: hypothetical protein VGC15_06800 [Acetobacteraceae bacterium]